MPNWRQYLDEDENEDFQNFQKIKRGQKKTEDDRKASKKRESVKHTTPTEK